MTHKLLVVEDEEHLAFALEFNLEQEGYAVDVATTISRARELLAAEHELIILDVMLPDGTGFDLCRQLRQAGNHVAILFLTAKGALDDIVTGLEAGGDDYVTKPFALKELMGRVGAMLRRKSWLSRSDAGHASDPGLYRFEHHVLDFERREATAFGKHIGLTDLEFRICKYFVDHAGRVVSREELLENVWEVSRDTNTRTVDVFVARLRRVFEGDPSRPRHFLTVRGAGYRFVPEPKE